jgi:phosphatidylinositol alpha-1,6-mannosyltransferase
VQLAIAGAGTRSARLERRRTGARAFLGRVADADLAGAVRVRATCSRCAAATDGSGIEAEGFGIVFLEAAAVRRPGGGRAERRVARGVVDGETGYVVRRAMSTAVRDAIAALVATRRCARAWGRRRAARGRRVRRTTVWRRELARSRGASSRPSGLLDR